MDDPTTDTTLRKPTRQEEKAARHAARNAELEACLIEVNATLAKYDAQFDVAIVTTYRNAQAIHVPQLTVIAR